MGKCSRGDERDSDPAEARRGEAKGGDDGKRVAKIGRVQKENGRQDARRWKTTTSGTRRRATSPCWSPSQTTCTRGHSASFSSAPWSGSRTPLPAPECPKYPPTNYGFDSPSSQYP